MADIKPPILPTDKPKLQAKKEVNKPNLNIAPMSKELSNRQNTSVVAQSPVKQQSPELVLSFKHKKLVISIVAVVLALALITGIVFAVWPKPTRPADIFINFDVTGEFDFGDIGFSYSITAGQANKLMPGDSFNSKFDITSTDDEGSTEEVYVRVRVVSVVESNQYSNIFSFNIANDNWYEGVDGYLYMKQTLKANTSVEFCNKLNLNKETGNYFQGKEIYVYFQAECLQAGSYSYQAITEEWPTAPYEWKALFYENRG